MTGFLVGNFSVNLTDNKWFIIEFTQSLPKVEGNVKSQIIYRQHIILNAQLAKSLMKVLKIVVDKCEKKYGKIKIEDKLNIIKDGPKEENSYIG